MWHLKRISAWIPVLAGLEVIAMTARAGIPALACAAVPGLLLAGGGLRMLMNPDLRGPQHAALGGVLGALLSMPMCWIGSGETGLTMLVSSVLAFVASGWYQIQLQPRLDDVPSPVPTPAYSAAVALDDAFLSLMAWLAPLPRHEELRDAVAESQAAFAILSERGWLAQPSSFHQSPPALESVSLAPRSVNGFDCESLHFDSGYEPHAGFPGRDRWLGYRENRASHSLILRHAKPAPWLVCVHGFGMGRNAAQDFAAFRAGKLHREAGLNIALFTLPVHGPRSPGGFNGAQYIGLSPVDLVHAVSQAVWDLRRLIGWIRRQNASRVGVFGISLGAYTSAVLASLEENLCFVIAGVPPSDVNGIREHAASSIERRLYAAAGFDAARDRAVNSVVSPLSLSPKVEAARRFMFAATGDQFVPIEQTRALWTHWQKPRIAWSTGGHVSALMQRAPRALVDEAIAASFSDSKVI